MRDRRVAAGLRLAVTMLTVAPLRAGRADRSTATVAMAAAPLVGAVLGAVLGAAFLGLAALDTPPLVTGVVVVGLGALLTRALHLDGLADTADALGSYRDRGAALDVMKRPDVGAFGVVALVLTLAAQAASIASAAGWPAFAAVVTATATGRVAIAWACRRGIPTARPEGMGALVAGTLPWPVPAVATAVTAALALAAVPARPWQGPLAVLAALAAAYLLVSHAVRRLGGITGDVLGAVCETATTVCLACLVVGLG